MLRTLLLIFFIKFQSCSTTFYIVRHAEKENTSKDSPLSKKGIERSEALNVKLNSIKIDSVFASNFIRTQQTVAPTAHSHNLPIMIKDQTKENLNKFIDQLKKIKGKNIVIAGHSNTVPEIIKGLTGQNVESIKEDEFDRFYKVKIGIRKKVYMERYGEKNSESKI